MSDLTDLLHKIVTSLTGKTAGGLHEDIDALAEVAAPSPAQPEPPPADAQPSEPDTPAVFPTPPAPFGTETDPESG